MGRKTTISVLLLCSAIAMNLHAQTEISAISSDSGKYYSTPYVVNPFHTIPRYGLPGDSLIKYRGFLKSNIFKNTLTLSSH